jgi:hypothetical protein
MCCLSQRAQSRSNGLTKQAWVNLLSQGKIFDWGVVDIVSKKPATLLWLKGLQRILQPSKGGVIQRCRHRGRILDLIDQRTSLLNS